ncbi:MAG: hypothetical protein JO353_13055 [Phycisphaerae bacterium]|nr:hypothetical protein [Phycisphaerae bacterium]
MTAIAMYHDLQRRPNKTRRSHLFTDGASIHPVRIQDADWQAGLTRNNEALRPFFNGAPVVGALAAKEGRKGWVLVVPIDYGGTTDGDDEKSCSAAKPRRIDGDVLLIPVPRNCR